MEIKSNSEVSTKRFYVGCGAFAIYAGELNASKTLWKRKSDVTDECLSASAQFLWQHDEKMIFEKDDKKYCLEVKDVDTNE